MKVRYLIACYALLCACEAAAVQAPVTLTINADQGRDTISRHISGQFAEHLGRGIYDGVWTREGSGPWHVRADSVQALKTIQVPNIRWPGGGFADYYHWKDGIGPLGKRQRWSTTTGVASPRTTASARTNFSTSARRLVPSRSLWATSEAAACRRCRNGGNTSTSRMAAPCPRSDAAMDARIRGTCASGVSA